MTTTLELKEQITNGFMDWFSNKMTLLLLSISMPSMAVSENYKNEMRIFLDDLLKRYICDSEQSSEAIDFLKRVVKQYPSVSIDERRKAAEMWKHVALSFGIVRNREVIETKTNRGQRT